MARALQVVEARPRPGADPRSRSGFRAAGLAIGLVGLAAAVVALINAIVAGVLAGRGGEEVTVARLLAWQFGLATTSFAVEKVAIVTILVGILVRLWVRVESAKAALPALKPAAEARPIVAGPVDTPYGRAMVSASPPGPLFIHRMARALRLPMAAMGAMVVAAGFIVSLVQSARTGSDPSLARSLSAWVQGLQFLGEAMLLGGISFVLGTILHGLRSGGGEVQASVGVPVVTLRVPTTAKLFVALMMLGMMVSVFQFIAYVIVATFDDAQRVASAFAWLTPVREAGLGVLLSGIVLALATIARVLGFQFWRLGQIITTGR
jgi:hypothetical protein